MSNQVSRNIAFVLAAMMLNGCATQQEPTIQQEPEVATPQNVGLVISEASPTSLVGSYAEEGREITFNITHDDICQTVNIWRSSGEPLFRVALCSTGDSLDLGSVFHAAGPSGSLMSGPMSGSSLSSPEVSRFLADPTFALVRDLIAELGQKLVADPSLGAARGPGLAATCDPFVQITCIISSVLAWFSCSSDTCCTVAFVGRTCADCLGLQCRR